MKVDNNKYVEYSSYINNAKNTLVDDLKRAVYMVNFIISLDVTQRYQCIRWWCDTGQLVYGGYFLITGINLISYTSIGKENT